MHPFFAITVRNGNSVPFSFHTAPYKKKPFPDSSLPDLPRDKPCRAIGCQGFCQRDHERGLADARVAGKEEVFVQVAWVLMYGSGDMGEKLRADYININCYFPSE